MEADKIKNEIINILVVKMGIKKDILEKIPHDMSMLDTAVGLKPRDLLTLFFELQKKYDILFEEKDIIDRRFYRIDNIVESIIEKSL